MRTLIVDDDALITQSLSTTLSIGDDIEIVGLGYSGPEAIGRHRELTPDILLMGTQMLGGDGFSTAERVLAKDAGVRIVFLIIFSDDEYIVRTPETGARGYLIKQDVAQVAPVPRSVMIEIRVLEGEVSRRSTTMRLGGPVGGREWAEEGPGASARDLRSMTSAALTNRKCEVVEAAIGGLNNAEVAARLFMSEGTVCNRISAILAKFDLRNCTQVAVMHYRCAQAG